MTELEDKTRDILREFASRRGHSSCFWHPDLLKRLGNLYGLDMDFVEDISLSEFRDGCALYRALKFGQEIPPQCEYLRGKIEL